MVLSRNSENIVNKKSTGKPRLVYILSPSYSGSTLLTMLLAQHPDISTIGELKATSRGDIDQYHCSCGELIKNCGFWSSVVDTSLGEGRKFSLEDFGTHFQISGYWWSKILDAQVRGFLFEALRKFLIATISPLQRTYGSILDQNRFLAEAICKDRGGSVFLDGSKDPLRLLYFIRSGLWDVDVIRMHRDGRAQSHSARRKSAELSFQSACKEWRFTVEQMDRVCHYIEFSKIHQLTYESLCEDPNLVMASLWDFLKLSAVSRDWRDVELKQSVSHILGNNMRTKSRIQISSDQAWEKTLTAQDSLIFEQIAGQLNRRLGY